MYHNSRISMHDIVSLIYSNMTSNIYKIYKKKKGEHKWIINYL